jgi:hypothetical protein
MFNFSNQKLAEAGPQQTFDDDMRADVRFQG